MSGTRSNSLNDEKPNFGPRTTVLSDSEIKTSMQLLTIIGLASDALWHHRLRQHYIGYPRTLNTCGIYAFWAAVWYCATKSGEWTHAAIAKDQQKIPIAAVPTYDGIWDHGAVYTAAQAKALPRKFEKVHASASCALIIMPVFARLTYAYRPWFWQRRLPFKILWLCGAAFTARTCLRGLVFVAWSRESLRKGHELEQVKAE